MIVTKRFIVHGEYLYIRQSDIQYIYDFVEVNP